MIDKVVLLTARRASTYWVYYKSGYRRHYNALTDTLPLSIVNFILNANCTTTYRDDAGWNLVNREVTKKEVWR